MRIHTSRAIKGNKWNIWF